MRERGSGWAFCFIGEGERLTTVWTWHCDSASSSNERAGTVAYLAFTISGKTVNNSDFHFKKLVH